MTPLGQRLARVAAEPAVDWTVLAENVPVWPEPPPVPALSWADGEDAYAPSQGEPALLAALAADAGVGAGAVLVTNGAFDGLALVLRRLHAAGARRLVCAGPVLRSVAGLAGRAGLGTAVVDWAAVAAGEPLPVGPGDAAYVNTPHNPTGACLPPGAAAALVADQARRGYPLVLDLVYDSFWFGSGMPAAPLREVRDWTGVYALNSFSKNYGAPGLRVGWLVTAPGTVGELTAALELERIAVSGTAQRRALALHAHGNAALVGSVGQGRKLVLDWAAERGFAVAPGDGGTQAWLDLGGDAEAFADRLMAEDRVVVTTGANYHPAHPGHLRLPLGAPAARLETGMAAIARAAGR